jgi:hypothetical protein
LKDVGDHRVRIISKPYQYYARWIPDATGKDVKISCAFRDDCKVCRPRMGDKNPQMRWYCLVIDRDDKDEAHPTGKIKILDMGPQIFAGIKSLNIDPDWGDVKKYDVKIHRGPKGANPLYTLKPASKSGFTAEEKTMALAALSEGSEGYINLSKMCEPMSCDEVHKLIMGTTKSSGQSDESFDFGQNGGNDLSDFDESEKSPAEGNNNTASDSEDDDFLDLN